MADGASSAPAPAPAPVAARGRPTAAPGPIELSDEKTVQTLATPDSTGDSSQSRGGGGSIDWRP